MGDAGEGLIDASSRLEERMQEIEDNRRLSRQAGPPLDPERVRALESLRLAKADIERQLATSVHDARRRQLEGALDEISRRLSDLQSTG